MATSMWTKLVENRVKGEDTDSENHLNFFDSCSRHKRDKKQPNLVSKLARQDTPVYECVGCDVDGVKEIFMYDGTFPKLTPQYFSSRKPKQLFYDRWNLVECFVSDRSFENLKETKTARVLFECIHTLWFVCFEIFVRNAPGKVTCMLYDYAYDRIFNIEAEG